jgi:hypothetical protein
MALLLANIFSDHEGWWRAALRWRLLTAFGLVSYGAYMYHQAVNVAFYGLMRGTEPMITGWRDAWLPLPVLAITFALAALSYRFFERPIRRCSIMFVSNQRRRRLLHNRDLHAAGRDRCRRETPASAERALDADRIADLAIENDCAREIERSRSCGAGLSLVDRVRFRLLNSWVFSPHLVRRLVLARPDVNRVP